VRLVENWRQAARWFSVQAFAAIIALPMIWASMPADVKAYLPDEWKPWIMVALAAAGVIGCLVDQKKEAA